MCDVVLLGAIGLTAAVSAVFAAYMLKLTVWRLADVRAADETKPSGSLAYKIPHWRQTRP